MTDSGHGRRMFSATLPATELGKPNLRLLDAEIVPTPQVPKFSLKNFSALTAPSQRETYDWLNRSFWALTDQSLITVSNFALNVLLARWLPQQEYGAFTVAFTIFLLLGAFHMAVIVEPMIVFGATKYNTRFSSYVTALLSGHWTFTTFSSFSLLAVAFVCQMTGSSTLAFALVALALTSPCILSLFLLRGVCYVRSENLPLAAASGGVYLSVMMSGFALLFWRGWLSATSGIFIMGVANLVAAIWLAIRLPVQWRLGQDRQLRHEAFNNHWNYGRWSVATYALIWVPENIYYLLLPLWGGLGMSAVLRALMNLLMPLMRLYSALSPLLLTAFAHAQSQTRSRQAQLSLVVLILGAVVYWLILGSFSAQLLSWFYGGQYSEYGNFLWLLGLVPLGLGVTTVLSAVLRALERPDLVFWAQAFATVVTLTLGVGLVWCWGVKGAIYGVSLSGATGALAMWVFSRRVRWSETKDLA